MQRGPSSFVTVNLPLHYATLTPSAITDPKAGRRSARKCENALVFLPGKRGIGLELMKRMLETLKDCQCIDLACDPEMQSFYEKLGTLRSTGMVIRRYLGNR